MTFLKFIFKLKATILITLDCLDPYDCDVTCYRYVRDHRINGDQKTGVSEILASREHLNICMVSDFFYPNVGGIESHIYQLSYCLQKRGHRVIIVTHMYGSRVGVRFISGGIKVYYLPIPPFHDQIIFPTMIVALPALRYIFLENDIHVVHGHSAFSPLAHEALFHAKLLGIHTVFTDHSLFGFADASSIVTNQLLCMTLATCDHVICVSHMSKENTVLRARFPDPWSVSVIPNAVDASKFLPKSHEKYTATADKTEANVINVVTMSRLVYRRGIDLLVDLIPNVCAKFPTVRFVIGGAGPKRIFLEEMRERERLQDRVLLLGRIDLDEVPKFLAKGSIYINTSLTEAFCISIIEAACVGLLVVSTKVGGIPEVLPPDMIRLAEPNARALEECLIMAISDLLNKPGSFLSSQECHERIRKMYCWDNVAERTETVYERALNKPIPTIKDLITVKYNHCGCLSRVLMTALVLLSFVVNIFCNFFYSVKKQPVLGSKYTHLTKKNGVRLKQE
ncbi:phosphatidylinositol N-acetylglucosaminyltransferase subunit A-like [Paramacrobiotus metropolitanus]|uniref:phosphatidylinositol N-acetylglucosaminyltransferase subunit A-like n=1 Tax=Paramacrobiotus metropolitanus TaxID=2943436 RepID=UPI002445C5F8|nr:phosphatidylinositol N-acetylglucosaminyltransferase subunit A-like [Paramacrobiotus metropolitanus]